MSKPATRKSNKFHVVRCSHNGKFTTYEIYHDNVLYLQPAGGIVLGKREAYTIVDALNSGKWWPTFTN